MTTKTAKPKLEFKATSVLAYENEHPDWSLGTMLQRMGEMRVSDLDTLAKLFGYADIDAIIDAGYTLQDMQEAIEGSKLLGFMASAGNR